MAAMPSERLWGGFGHARLWGCVGNLPRVGTTAREAVPMGAPLQSCPATGGDIWVTQELLAGMEPGAESVRRALGAEDGVRLDGPTLCLHLSGGWCNSLSLACSYLIAE